MKVTFEFDTESENFNSIELERHKQADDMAKALSRSEKASFLNLVRTSLNDKIGADIWLSVIS